MNGRSKAGWMLLLAAGFLTGCGGTAAPAPTTPVDMDVESAWLDGGRLIGIVTWGSSSCPPMDGEATLADDGTLDVVLVDPAATDPDRACTADFAPRITAVGVPDGVDPAQPLSLAVSLGAATGRTTLAGVPGLGAPDPETDYQPSAGWTGTPGTLAYLTWGSSTCVPAVQDIAVTGDAQVTVTFQEPAADRMCTMDMVPRPGLLEVTDLTTPVGAQLVLSGDGVDATVPILGGA